MKKYLILFALILIYSCDCNCDDCDSTDVPQVPDEVASGIWEGTYTETGVGTFELIGLIEGDEMRLVSFDAGVVYIGTNSISGTNLTATATGYQLDGIVGTEFATTDMTGTVSTKSSISGTLTNSDGGTGTFSLTYVPADSEDTYQTYEGTWTDISSGTATITSDGSDTITGTDINGCAYIGEISTTYITYLRLDIRPQATTCYYYGAYLGWIFISDTVTENDTLTVVIRSYTSDQYVIAYRLTRI